MKTDVIIIGGGPAGIACAIWLHKMGVSCLLLEGAAHVGGLQKRSPYENLWIPGVQGQTGQQVAQALEDHVMTLGVPVRKLCPVVAVSADGRRTVTTADEVLEASFLVIATGSRPRSGGFSPSPTIIIGPGDGMEALEVAGQRIAILGGGDNAFDQARFVRDRGGKPVIFSRHAPRAQKLLQGLIPDVPVVVGDYHADPAAMTVNGEAFAAFGIMYGFEAVVPEGLQPTLDGGYIRVDRFGETSISGVFACGEVTDYWHPCVTTSAAHGIQVARSISRRLNS
ncbi:NAD(P)/FAD-dependent oxidoreductase [Asticcacaulis sp. EMRT-3]|uniref:NAD(P)/FAD-dependent oxidoreductase n=1 Tax=Asticcacaulis sp. EMRT-3 TaxID=3040349 RepID=UPI0024AF0DFD|nr:NAD(P)/FAD-dependent oxidoreductase [Asticcacaulis sp. EMRT-3]MDI7776061.1 NAD(P)/FAD-dependent oxidoreductase [Asticcacaulis sp. EMRT-3]